LIANALKCDFSWKAAAQKYINLYFKSLSRSSSPLSDDAESPDEIIRKLDVQRRRLGDLVMAGRLDFD